MEFTTGKKDPFSNAQAIKTGGGLIEFSMYMFVRAPRTRGHGSRSYTVEDQLWRKDSAKLFALKDCFPINSCGFR